ncbi:MAG: alpha/beta hydrolase [Beutenbergiaceae bacterium]
MSVPEPSIDKSAIWWSAARADRAEALATRPLVVMLHGYGADEMDLAGLSAQLPQEFVYASVRAPLAMGGFGGYAWFPLGLPDLNPDTAYAAAAAAALVGWLTNLREGATTALAVLGFSQGAAMALQVMRSKPELVTAGVLLSGLMLEQPLDGDSQLAQARPPVFVGFDPMDPVIPASRNAALLAFLDQHTTASTHTYAVGHGIGPAEVADIANFLGEQCPPS